MPLKDETKKSASNNDVDIITENLLYYTTPCFEALTNLLIETARAQGINLSPLSAHYHDPETAPANVYVMNYSSVESDDAQEIVQKLLACV